jgi:hypothetical protein
MTIKYQLSFDVCRGGHTTGREGEDFDYLRLRDFKPFGDFVDGGTGFEILEDGGDGHAGVAKNPGTT